MYFKKLVSGLLAAALVVTSVQLPAAAAEGGSVSDGVSNDGLIASYTFNGTLANGVENGTAASAIATGLIAYNSNLEYVEGKDGTGIKLGDYGLMLDSEGLGENFAVSAWMKPDGTLAVNQAVLFAGEHVSKRQDWIGVAGNKSGTNQVKFWEHGGTGELTWSTLATPDISAEWHHVVLTGSSTAVEMYVDGTKVEKTGDATESIVTPFTTEGSYLCVGVNSWDTEFTGTVDEVNVYNKFLSDAEVTALYNATKDKTGTADFTKEQYFAWGEVIPTISGTVKKGETGKISVELPKGIEASDVTLTYKSTDEQTATVDNNGTVSGVKGGKTEITVTAALNNKPGDNGSYGPSDIDVKSGTVEVTVFDPDQVELPDDMVAYYTFDDSSVTNLTGKETATLCAAEAKKYSGAAVYEEGMNEDKGKALKLGSYGLKLNQANLGKEFTLSMWMKASAALPSNRAVTLLGTNNPAENWIAIAGNDGTNTAKVWAKDAEGGLYSWDTVATQEIPQSWQHITFVGTDGEISFYVNGVKKWTIDSSNPLDEANGDILVGITYWQDGVFPGSVDDIMVFNTAKTDEEVSQIDEALFNGMLQASADKEFTEEMLLGKNTDKEDVKYNLNLPDELDGATVTWTSTKPDVVAADGTVINTAQQEEVTLSAEITAGILKATKEITVKVAALDRSELDQLVEEAKEIDTTYATAASKERLEAAIAAGEAAKSYEQVETATEELNKAISAFKLQEEYVNPFGLIAEPVAKQTIKVGESKQLVVIPESIKDTTTIEYLTSNDGVVKFANGTATGAAIGKATVTAIVTSKYNNYVMEYSVALDVVKADDPIPTPDPGNGNGGGNNNGGSNNGGSNTDGNNSTVAPDTAKAELNISKLTMGKGEKVTLKVLNTTGKVTFKSSKTKVATVASNGKITAKKKGSATITATLADGTTLNCKVTVKNAPKKITLKKSKASLKKGKTTKIKVKFPSGTASYKLTYKSNKKSIATVDATGKVTAKKKGSATITVTTFNKKTAKFKVTVK